MVWGNSIISDDQTDLILFTVLGPYLMEFTVQVTNQSQRTSVLDAGRWVGRSRPHQKLLGVAQRNQQLFRRWNRCHVVKVSFYSASFYGGCGPGCGVPRTVVEWR